MISRWRQIVTSLLHNDILHNDTILFDLLIFRKICLPQSLNILSSIAQAKPHTRTSYFKLSEFNLFKAHTKQTRIQMRQLYWTEFNGRVKYYTYIPTHNIRNISPKPMNRDATIAINSSFTKTLVTLVLVTS